MTVYPWQHPASRHKPCIQAKIVLMKCQESLVMIFPLAPGQCCKWPSEMTHQSVFVGTGSVACEVSFSSVVGVITISCRPSPSVWRRCSRRSAGPCDRSERQLRCLDDQGCQQRRYKSVNHRNRLSPRPAWPFLVGDQAFKRSRHAKPRGLSHDKTTSPARRSPRGHRPPDRLL